MGREERLSKNYRGVIIEESLEERSVLNRLKILETKVDTLTDYHKTPWLKRWTKHRPAKHSSRICLEDKNVIYNLVLRVEFTGSRFAVLPHGVRLIYPIGI